MHAKNVRARRLRFGDQPFRFGLAYVAPPQAAHAPRSPQQAPQQAPHAQYAQYAQGPVLRSPAFAVLFAFVPPRGTAVREFSVALRLILENVPSPYKEKKRFFSSVS